MFGSATVGAIIAFQKSHGLSATGKVDSATAAALGLSPMNAPTPRRLRSTSSSSTR